MIQMEALKENKSEKNEPEQLRSMEQHEPI